MKPIYINGIGCVSIQNTHNKDYFLDEVIDYDTNTINALNPDYKQKIPVMQLRRMGNSIKMALFASMLAMEDAEISQINAIITGTGLGCQKDSEKFIKTMLENDEQYLNPTPFIQSTHNMAAAAIALSLGCKEYNMTYVDGSTSFDSALLDAKLYLNERIDERENQNVLIGSVDESSEKFNMFFDRIGLIKKEKCNLINLLNSKTEGTIFSEGASFFIVSDIPNENSYGKIIALEKLYKCDDINNSAQSFLEKNGFKINDIDAVFLGYNGNFQDNFNYDELSNKIFKNILQLSYKNVFGENESSSGNAVWLASKILKNQKIPQIIKLNNIENSNINNILIYHQLNNENHSFILISK